MDKLPGSIWQDINKIYLNNKEDMELVYAADWESKQNNWLNHGNYNGNPSGKFKFVRVNYNSYSHHQTPNNFEKPLPTTNTSGPMDLDIIHLANTECYNFHKKGHISRNCKTGNNSFQNNNTHSSGDRRKPNSLIMDYIPPFQDPENGYIMKGPKESEDSINGQEEPRVY